MGPSCALKCHDALIAEELDAIEWLEKFNLTPKKHASCADLIDVNCSRFLLERYPAQYEG
jgi:hypothetical protein